MFFFLRMFQENVIATVVVISFNVIIIDYKKTL